ncbi:MAG: hypothetical protein A2149_00195 [Candidatus Schekmanbacteria bacterium RBG_16_38_11]|uniref:Uncharacterized protein n=1 Tax=Candidatus Schekmanbacteria bacterium RBG_16_38_11 TaxID=1817880 RepID=A0A1F7RUU0_9BACT|nr:MAG: hypothetical protein A2149_00195 [Candidatus Schekmanbacteria bacterium RBG_16_38_11]
MLKNPSNVYIVKSNAVFVPIGKCIILKKGNQYGVIKFILAEEKKAIYEWAYNINPNGFFSQQHSLFGKSKLKNFFIPIWGGGIQLGNMYIKCGEIIMGWSSKSWVSLSNYEGRDSGIEVSPTGWSSLEDVNVFNKKLKWYKFDSSRKEKIIPIENLTP